MSPHPMDQQPLLFADTATKTLRSVNSDGPLKPESRRWFLSHSFKKHVSHRSISTNSRTTTTKHHISFCYNLSCFSSNLKDGIVSNPNLVFSTPPPNFNSSVCEWTFSLISRFPTPTQFPIWDHNAAGGNCRLMVVCRNEIAFNRITKRYSFSTMLNDSILSKSRPVRALLSPGASKVGEFQSKTLNW